MITVWWLLGSGAHWWFKKQRSVTFDGPDLLTIIFSLILAVLTLLQITFVTINFLKSKGAVLLLFPDMCKVLKQSFYRTRFAYVHFNGPVLFIDIFSLRKVPKEAIFLKDQNDNFCRKNHLFPFKAPLSSLSRTFPYLTKPNLYNLPALGTANRLQVFCSGTHRRYRYL